MTEDSARPVPLPPSRVHELMRLSRADLITMWLDHYAAVSSSVREAVSAGVTKEAIVTAIVNAEEGQARSAQSKGSK